MYDVKIAAADGDADALRMDDFIYARLGGEEGSTMQTEPVRRGEMG